MKLKIEEGTSVFTASGDEVGKINRFILDPRTNEVTHIGVQKGWLFSEDKVVPMDWVSTATEERVTLNENTKDFDQLPPFEETHFIEVNEEGMNRVDHPSYRYAPAYYWYPPAGYIGHPVGYYGLPPMETQQNIPPGTVPLKEGSDVISLDGEHVGDIERILVDSNSNQVTHFLISEGLLFKERKLVPAHWVSSAEEDKVHLNVSSQMLERVPAYRE